MLLESSGASIAPAASVAADVLQALKECPTKNYVVVEQDWVSAADYADGRSTPRLAHYMSGQQPEVKSIVSVPDVVGSMDSKIIQYLEDHCGTVKTIKLDGPPTAPAMRSGVRSSARPASIDCSISRGSPPRWAGCRPS